MNTPTPKPASFVGSLAHKVWRHLQRFLELLNRRVATSAVRWLRSRAFKGLLLFLILAGLLATFLMPWDGVGDNIPTGWDTALGSAAQVIGGATAVVFALLVVPVQNTAARYSPIFLGHIRRDRWLWGLFGWTVIALIYTLASLIWGATPVRVVVAASFTVTVILALAGAAFRVMSLLNPIELTRMLESDALRRLPRLIADEKDRVDKVRERVEAATGHSIPADILGYPVPEPVVRDMRNVIQLLLSIAAGTIQSGQVDVAEAVLTSVTNMMRAYLQQRGGSATADDPLVTRVSEELLSLSQAAQHATSLQVLPEVVRALGRLAAAGVEVSTPGIGLGERDVAVMPVGHLQMVALANITNINSIAPALATEQLGSTAYELLRRGLPASVAGVVARELSLVMHRALKPFAYHVAGVGATWLMKLWSLACATDGGEHVRDAIIKTGESFLRAYRSQPVSEEGRMAIAPLVDPLRNQSGLIALPAGAAVVVGLLNAQWPPDGELIKDVQHLGDRLIQELVWPAASGEFHDRLGATWAMEQAVEMAVLLAAIASGTFQHPRAHAAGAKTDLDSPSPRENDLEEWAAHAEDEAAEAWAALCRILIGTCGRFTEVDSGDDIGISEWDVSREALTGVSACIVAALVFMQRGKSDALDGRLGVVVDKFCDLGETMVNQWAVVFETNPVIQHLRLVGTWLLHTGRNEWAKRIGRIVFRARRAPYRFDYHAHLYPTTWPSRAWQPPIMSITAQMALPSFLNDVRGFLSNTEREPFEQLIREVSGERNEDPEAPQQESPE